MLIAWLILGVGFHVYFLLECSVMLQLDLPQAMVMVLRYLVVEVERCRHNHHLLEPLINLDLLQVVQQNHSRLRLIQALQL